MCKRDITDHRWVLSSEGIRVHADCALTVSKVESDFERVFATL